MKKMVTKIIAILMMITLIATISGCGMGVDYDLTKESTSVTWDDMCENPDDYIGKTVRICGKAKFNESDDWYSVAPSDSKYYATYIAKKGDKLEGYNGYNDTIIIQGTVVKGYKNLSSIEISLSNAVLVEVVEEY